jgi:hypothetical protein
MSNLEPSAEKKLKTIDTEDILILPKPPKKKIIKVNSLKKPLDLKKEILEESALKSTSPKMTKQKLGQFYTTNYEYILQDLYIPNEQNLIMEPFAGQGDLLKFIQKYHNKTIHSFDIDPKSPSVIKRDTLMNPPSYCNSFIITNPPYLARNKSKSKELFDKYNTNDLYKCFIKQLCIDECNGGILIIPLNFWCSIRKSDIELRRDFLNIYNVLVINIFEERVFDDTSYTTCSFLFLNNKIHSDETISINIKPHGIKLTTQLNVSNNFTFGGHIYSLPQSKIFNIERATKSNIEENSVFLTNILVKCIDDSIHNKICMSIVSDSNRYIDDTPKSSARSYATLIINPKISLIQQKNLVNMFNSYLNEQRDLYYSLFLTNYRESNTIARKRISFSLVFEIVNYLLTDPKYSSIILK